MVCDGIFVNDTDRQARASVIGMIGFLTRVRISEYKNATVGKNIIRLL
jgi:hypothetical protein